LKKYLIDNFLFLFFIINLLNDFKSWNTMQDQIEEINKSILGNCDFLEKDAITKLDTIIRDERDTKEKLKRDKKKYDDNLTAVCII
jgi:hypothetical protein